MDKGRGLVWTFLGLAFVVTLAIVVGRRLSAEAMAVVIGVIAGVAASIPTSLIVVWVTSRAHLSHAQPVIMRTAAQPANEPSPAPRGPEPREPRIVVMAPPAYQNYPTYPVGPHSLNGYGQQQGYAPSQYPAPAMLPPRRFTVVGGGEVAAETELEAEAAEVTVWER
jgi:hypothetical protein